MHASDETAYPLPQGGSFMGHPRLLWMLLFVTVWFNFAFYGFRAFLAPYAAQAFFSNLPQAQALQQADLLFAGFGTLLYALTIIGGWVADNVLGEVRALRLSLWLMIPALLGMASPTRAGFVMALAAFVLAAGLNIPLTVLIGRNYAKNDPGRDAGYTLYYLAINFGGFIAPFICAAWIGVHYGYRLGFVAAAAGMLLGTLAFEWRQRRLPGADDTPRFHRRWSTPAVIVAWLVLIVPTALLMSHAGVLHSAVYALMAALIAYFAVGCMRRGDRVQNHRYIALLLLFIALVVFWALSLLSASALNFFARDHVAPLWNGTLLGVGWSYLSFQSANPLYILILAPFIAMLWPWLEKRSTNPSTPRKFGIGLLMVALGYGVLWWAIAHAQQPDGRIAAWPMLLNFLFATIGELALSPIGYALIGKLAAPDETSLAMGGWFFGVGVSYDLSGQIAALTTAHGNTGIVGYEHVFAWLMIGGVAIALVYLITAPWIVKLMHGVR
ncbi:MAG TPA: peptide MFS transporter [Rhodanobacteraceae bacterium]|jgi:POT family proton-dependent oligopeptide transporter|nr:peptide MFS transporter [Rhodanobacteraceae bacterium]